MNKRHTLLQQGNIMLVVLVVMAVALVGGYAVYQRIQTKSSLEKTDQQAPGESNMTQEEINLKATTSVGGDVSDTQLDAQEKSMETKLKDLDKDSSSIDQGLSDTPGDLSE